MDRNVCRVDRTARTALALGLLAVGYRTRDEWPGTLAFVAGSDILATAVIGRCPLNALFGIDSCGG